MKNADLIRVHDPLSRRFLFAFDPELNLIVIRQRGITTEVDLTKLRVDPSGLSAIVSRPDPPAELK